MYARNLDPSLSKHVLLVATGDPRVLALEIAAHRDVVGCVLDVVSRSSTLTAGGVARDMPPVEGVVEVWTREPSHVLEESCVNGILTYRVESHSHRRRERSWPLGQRTPGVKRLVLVRRVPHLDAAGFRAAWLDVHVPLALRHHVGMCAYVTDVVVDAPAHSTALDGVSQLYFASRRDFEEGMYADDQGRREIEDDVRGFVGAAVGYEVDEYVLTAPPDLY